jgi:hypothetical protein
MIPNGAQQLAERPPAVRGNSWHPTGANSAANNGLSVNWFTFSSAAAALCFERARGATEERIVRIRLAGMRIARAGTRVTDDGR